MLSPQLVITVKNGESIQAAIDRAPELSRIEIEPGIYKERLWLTKAIELVGKDGPDFDAVAFNPQPETPKFKVIIDGTNVPLRNGHQSLLLIEGTRRIEKGTDSFQAKVTGIEFRNSGSTSERNSGQSGGITINKADAVVANNFLHDLTSQDGSAISIQGDSRTSLVNNIIANNTSSQFGAVMDTRNTRGTVYSNNGFYNNTAKEGTAVYHDFGSGLFVSNLVKGNAAVGSTVPTPTTPIKEAKGAIMLRKDSTMQILENKFLGNSVSGSQPHSGALNIETEGSRNLVMLNVFAENKVSRTVDKLSDPGYSTTGNGGAIGIFNNSTPLIQFNLFKNNVAGFGGSAIASSERAVPTIKNNAFISNKVDSSNEDSQLKDKTRSSVGTVFLEAVGTDSDKLPVKQAIVASNYFKDNAAGHGADIYVGSRAAANINSNTFDNSFILAKDFNQYASGVPGVASSIVIENNPQKSPPSLTELTGNLFLPNGGKDNSMPFSSLSQFGVVNLLNDINLLKFSKNIWVESFPGFKDLENFSQLFSRASGVSDKITAPIDSTNTNSWSSSIVSGKGLSTSVSINTPSPSNILNFSNTDFQGFSRTDGTLSSGAIQVSRNSIPKEMEAPVYRFRKNSSVVSHFYTADSSEKDFLANLEISAKKSGEKFDWILEGVATNFKVSKDPLINYNSSDASIDPLLGSVYRFFNPLSGTHFYTSEARERDSVLVNNPHYLFEGIAFFALKPLNSVNVQDTNKLERFYNNGSSSHFYTADSQEASALKNQISAGTNNQFSYDGLTLLVG